MWLTQVHNAFDFLKLLNYKKNSKINFNKFCYEKLHTINIRYCTQLDKNRGLMELKACKNGWTILALKFG